MTVALGITSYNRPVFLEKTLKAVRRHLSPEHVFIYDDGSDAKLHGSLERAFRVAPAAHVERAPANRGVAYAKNRLLERMLNTEVEWLFLLEDDIRPLTDCLPLYIGACEASGWQHLSFAHHGPANAPGAVEVGEHVTCWPHYVGSFCVYSRGCLESVGLFDEHFTNAFEHVEHTLRLAAAGFTDPRPWHAADATGSERWLCEIQGSIERSAIRPRPDWQANIANSLGYWAAERPETFTRLWPLPQPVG